MDDRLILRDGASRTERPVGEGEAPVLLEELFGVTGL
jgi:hypothetical protein